ncbi:N-D-ribosylpurine ribohydrolase [Chlorella sorokiniana]|uniref:N-D-ribosylpurine ribohydrolase n=1 Tax=Chlorella sorokiniana TaxID=3076 RepID=A0A2P6TFL3_CHLSO|nr:N-D-ribosylpurine ribohydrolase [Chlorella sorokiniana]|eukprot:PRW32902.1 N-D-ribosylpurine ribohydrolase [Chlorella sorokiniana]
MARPVWLDCDPGHDDALALILAGHSPALDLLGVSTVAGNETVEKVTDNALRVLAAAGQPHIEVVAGAAKPLLRAAPLLCAEIHGETGLDGPLGGPVLPPAPHGPLTGKAPMVMFERIAAAHQRLKAAAGAGGANSSSGGDGSGSGKEQPRVALIATAALTNVALLLALYPEVADMVEIVIMGGCLGVGNTGAVMEFNIQTDPEAARMVFESGIPLTMVPLEVTHTALATTSVLQRVRTHSPTPFLRLMVDLLMFFADTYRTVFKFEDPPLHDPCAVAYVIAPHLFKTELLRVDVETASSLSAGQTVVDIWHQSTQPKNCTVCMEMDVARFWDLQIEAIHAADRRSPLNSSSDSGGGNAAQ